MMTCEAPLRVLLCVFARAAGIWTRQTSLRYVRQVRATRAYDEPYVLLTRLATTIKRMQ